MRIPGPLRDLRDGDGATGRQLRGFGQQVAQALANEARAGDGAGALKLGLHPDAQRLAGLRLERAVVLLGQVRQRGEDVGGEAAHGELGGAGGRIEHGRSWGDALPYRAMKHNACAMPHCAFRLLASWSGGSRVRTGRSAKSDCH